MILRNVDFGHVWDASGVRGFFGEGYWYHAWLKALLGFSFKGATFVGKTTTYNPRGGNMLLASAPRWTPLRLFPDCIAVNWRKAAAVNSVGLSGPGVAALWKADRWQTRTKPFMLSFMSVAGTREERMAELRLFVDFLLPELHELNTEIGLQLNFSCPNTGHDPAGLINEIDEALTIAANLGVPLVVKLNALTPIPVAVEIGEHPGCDAICVSNTIPWGKHPGIDWKSLFGSDESPLPKKYGGGGLSGASILPIVEDWIRRARAAGFRKPINAGGGITCPADVKRLKDAGADSVFLGTIVMLRPWNYRRTVRYANHLFAT